jgi:flagellar biosynthesis/type III secretory pathway protein FliH
MCEHVDMPATEETVAALRKAVRAKKTAEDRADAARAALANVMADAIREGMKQGEVVAVTGYTREHVRRLVREVEDARAARAIAES